MFALQPLTDINLEHINIVNIACEVCCLLFLAVLLIALLLKREKSRSVWSISIIYIGEFVSMSMDVAARLLHMRSGMAWLIPMNYTVSFAMIAMVVCGFYWYFLALLEEKTDVVRFSNVQRRAVVPFAAVFIILFTVAIWRGGLLPCFAELPMQQRFYHAVNGVTLPIVVTILFIIFSYRRLLRKRELVITLSYCLLPHIIEQYDYVNGTVFMHISMTVISCLFFISITVEIEQELESKKKALAESQLYSLIQQINPHFIFNTLASIDSLCRTDPLEAQRLISKFSDYLWDNYADMNRNPMIPFIKEKEHIDHYLAIETVRFPRLNVEYDLKVRDFQIPSLTVQPLVENAVKYGICRRRKSEGTIRISTYETETGYVVCVEDNGPGFDPEKATESDESHVGIANVRKRLAILCGGTLEIESRIDEGTVCTMVLPKEDKNEGIVRRRRGAAAERARMGGEAMQRDRGGRRL